VDDGEPLRLGRSGADCARVLPESQPAGRLDGVGNAGRARDALRRVRQHLSSVAYNSAFSTDRLYTLGFAGASRDYGAAAASVELRGTFTFTAHGVPVTFADPLVTLAGTTGTLKASGTSGSPGGQTTPYDRSKTQFNLDLSNAMIATGADGARVISGIVPLGTADTFIAFGPNARLYGTLELTLAVAETPASVAPPAAGPQGPAGPAGRSALIRTLVLKHAPFAGNGEHKVKRLDRRTRAVLASGTVKRRTLRIAYLEGTRLAGSYTPRLSWGKVARMRETVVAIRP
jgi:hypothetical protein